MEWNRHHCNLLVKLFNEKWYKSIRFDYERWRDYLAENGVFSMGLDSVTGSWNRFGDKYVCIENPTEDAITRNPTEIAKTVGFSRAFNSDLLKDSIWYLVPKDFAEEALKLRMLP